MPPGDPTYASLDVHLLGAFRVFVDGVQVETGRWPRRKMKLLIKLLALQPRRQLHREQVQAMLWPELNAESAANNLYKTIHLVRHALEPDLKSGAVSRFIITQGQQIVLQAPGAVQIDMDEFQ
jgi:DNA-binding SARP family transcriptional activator